MLTSGLTHKDGVFLAEQLATLRMTATEAEVRNYVQRHNLVLTMETLSSLLLTHRPQKPASFLRKCMITAMANEEAGKKSKKSQQQESFGDLLYEAVPAKPATYTDGRPVTSISEKPDNFKRYLEQHRVKEVFEDAMEWLIIQQQLPEEPHKALRAYFEELVLIRE